MKNYLHSLQERIGKEESSILICEAAEAFAETDLSVLPARAGELHELVRFCEFDAIAPWLRDEREALGRVLAYARKNGADEVAEILADALAGKPRDLRISISVPGAPEKIIDVDAGDITRFDGVDFGGTDIALSMAIDVLEDAILAELVDAADEFALTVPARLQARAVADARIADEADGRTALDLFLQLVRSPKPTVLAGDWEDAEQGSITGATAVPVSHLLAPPAKPASLARIRAKCGPAVDALLEIYAVHDGAGLFRFNGESGFELAPIAAWDEMLDQAVTWAREVTWQDDEDEIPAYLYSAIAFGAIPGDSERWLLVTEGPHAGKIMMSDTDLIEDKPRFESARQFFSVLLHDTGRILGSGGFIRYELAGKELFPIAFRSGA